MDTVSFDVKLDEKASRVELFVRIIWYVISYIVLYVFSIVAGVCLVVEWILMLILGRRVAALNSVLVAFQTYIIRLFAYAFLLTEERSPLLPFNAMMNTVTFNVKYVEKASRIELFVRIIWAIPTVIVLFVFEIVAFITVVINWLIILFTGKRNMGLAGFFKSYMKYLAQFDSYFLLLTDERSPILPS